MKHYTQQTEITKQYIKQKINEFILEDMPKGDITTEKTIKNSARSKANIQACEKFVFVGEKIIPHFFNNQCNIDIKKKDGEFIKKNEIIGIVTGPSKEILKKERIMLNLIQHLSGIATITRKMADRAKPYKIKILDTRKTTPGLRLLEKYSVKKGGGFNHRLNLSTGVLIKDNHLEASGGITNAVKKIRNTGYKGIIELEIDTIEQAKEGIKNKICYFLLDNMQKEETKNVVNLIRKSKNGKNIFIESSGGINLKNMDQYLKTGINAISSGSITQTKKSPDIKLEFIQ